MKEKNFLYGLHSVKALLQCHPEQIQQLWVEVNRRDQRIQEIMALANEADIHVERISAASLEKKIGGVKHQGVLASCRSAPELTEEALIEKITHQTDRVVLLILDGIQDPHNLGACLRSANAFGVTAVIIPKDRAASLTEVTRKVACGAAELTPVIRVTNLHRTLKQLKEVGVWLVGLDESATESLSAIQLKNHVGVVMGGEGEGLRRLTRESCDYLAKIPMMGQVESLNVSVATGIALYTQTTSRCEF